MLRKILLIFMCVLMSQTLYADADGNQLDSLPNDGSLDHLPKDGGSDSLPKDGGHSGPLPKDGSLDSLPEDVFTDLHNLKPIELCPEHHLLSWEQTTAAMEYNQDMQEKAEKLNDLDQYLKHFVIEEHTFENCLLSIKDIMMDPNSNKDAALAAATCFNVDYFSTPEEGSEVETHIIADVKEVLSNILALIKRRIEMAYATASSVEQREAIVACTSYSDLW